MYYFQKLTQLSQRNNVLDTAAFKIHGFFGVIRVFLNSAEQAHLEQRQTISTMKLLRFRKYSFKKFTQFSQGNSVLDAPAPSIGAFLNGNTHMFLFFYLLVLYFIYLLT
jgi:hypothetical protein